MSLSNILDTDKLISNYLDIEDIISFAQTCRYYRKVAMLNTDYVLYVNINTTNTSNDSKYYTALQNNNINVAKYIRDKCKIDLVKIFDMILSDDSIVTFNCFYKITDIYFINDIMYSSIDLISKYVIRINIGTIMHYKSTNILSNLSFVHPYITNDLVIKYLLHHPKVTEFLYNHLKYNEYEWCCLIKKRLSDEPIYHENYSHRRLCETYPDLADSLRWSLSKISNKNCVNMLIQLQTPIGANIVLARYMMLSK